MGDGLFAKPQSTSKQVEIQFNAATVNTTFFDATVGSDIPALTGYVLNNAGSSGTALVSFFNGGTAGVTVNSLSVAAGKYQSFFVLGADTIAIRTTVVSTIATGDLNIVLNNNPL
ncbi:hypothetical protein [Ectobacillus funiculus]|uniref:DUF4397 domain-containing protein n=1 Tax=Ectobacillus funiculus TaxID=137993 RepID=A0ABV5WLQ0_9BACI